MTMLTVQEKVQGFLPGVESDTGDEAAGLDPMTSNDFGADRLDEKAVYAEFPQKHFLYFRDEDLPEHNWIQLPRVLGHHVSVGDAFCKNKRYIYQFTKAASWPFC